MSHPLLERLFPDCAVVGPARLVVLVLAWHVNEQREGLCNPSIATIAREAGLSRSQAQRLIRGLIREGYVRVLANAKGGANLTPRYALDVDRLCARGRTGATPVRIASRVKKDLEGSHAGQLEGSHTGPSGVAPMRPERKNEISNEKNLAKNRDVAVWIEGLPATLRGKLKTG